MAPALIAASMMGAAGASTATVVAASTLAVASGGIGAMQALGKAKYESRVASFQAEQTTLEGKIAYNESRAKSLAMRQQNNVLNSQAIVNRNSKGTMSFGGDSGATAMESLKGVNAFNLQMSLNAGEAGLASSQSRAASIRLQGKNAKRAGRAGVITSLLGTK
jgi:hypothetical protein